MLGTEEQENHYEVTFCVRNGEGSVCTQHGDGTHRSEPYTFMEGSINGNSVDTNTNVQRSTSTIVGQTNDIRNASSSLRSSELQSPSEHASARLYSTVNSRSAEAYSFANEAFTRHSSPQISIHVSSPEHEAGLECGRKLVPSRRVRRCSPRLIALIAILTLSMSMSMAAIATGISLFSRIESIETSNSHLKNTSKMTATAGPSVTTDRIIDPANACPENSCDTFGGLCIATKNGKYCVCKDGWTGNGINCTVITYPTCSKLRKVAGYNTGYYTISPDPDKTAPMTVRCVMERDTGVTEIDHDSEAKTLVNGCNLPGCYIRNITYFATLKQIDALISVSSHCSQSIKYECYRSRLKNYAWWISRIGTKETYWDEGATSGSCACSKDNGTCPGCFCNNNDSQYRKDEGYITNKTLLPIVQLRYGDVGESWSDGFHTLGKLRCFD